MFDPSLKKLIADSDAEIIFHAAAMTDRHLCEEKPELACHANIEGTIAIARAAKALVLPILYFSDISVFGGTENTLEWECYSPNNVLGFTKAAAEDFICMTQPRHVVVLPGCIYGPGNQGSDITRLFESHMGDSVRIDTDPDCRRPYIYIEDFVTGIDTILANFFKLCEPEKNVRRLAITNNSVTLDEIITHMENEMNMTLNYEFHPETDKLGDKTVSADRLEALGWKPHYDIWEGLSQMREFYRSSTGQPRS
jgi:nucleoside-diphosphate-sugar epimerase